MQFDIKKILPYCGALLLFLLIAYAYTPQVLQGRIVNQSDISGWTGMSHEIVTYNRNHPDDRTLWTDSMFGGMPATVISVVYKGDFTQYLYDLLFIGERPASYLFISLLGGFLLCLAFGANIRLSILGAVAITFCSYNMQIIQVGHNSKMVAIAFMPWVTAAMVYAYRKSMLWGALFFAFALSFQIKANHPQITYYLAMILLGFVIWQLCAAIKERWLPRFIKSSALLLVAGLLGIATNINHLWPTYEYSHYSIRGGSELAAEKGEKKIGGLDIEYATAWSYGVEESLNLLIPNFNGGASIGELGSSSKTYKTLQQNGYAAEQIAKGLPLYWGPQSFTAGPMYMGAITLFLAILGLFVVKGGAKWWIAALSLLALMLSWGYHFMPVTKLFFNFAPLYNKFRTVSMILVILQILLPLLAILSLRQILFNGTPPLSATDRKKNEKAMALSLGITCGISLLFLLIPSLAGNFAAPSDSQMSQLIASSLADDRVSLLRKDALRTILFIAIAALIIKLAMSGKLKANQAVMVVTLLVLTDLWSIDKRYLNGSHFVTRREFDTAFAKRAADEAILQDKEPDYRVLDLTTDPFNDATPSYYHKTVGGYSPAKLQRYQDIIENSLSQEIGMLTRALSSARSIEEAQSSLGSYPTLNMLNTKYIIINGSLPPLVNHSALGNGWFVKRLVRAEGAAMEMELLKKSNPAEEAVVEEHFLTEEYLGTTLYNMARPDSLSHISLLSYAPNRLRYSYRSSCDAVAVFSEIYYPKGWRATLKSSAGEERELPIFRADYILRGLYLPAGSGEITFTFNPQSFIKGERYSMASSILLYLALTALIGGTIYKRRRKQKDGK